jgi:hypothetical protein
MSVTQTENQAMEQPKTDPANASFLAAAFGLTFSNDSGTENYAQPSEAKSNSESPAPPVAITDLHEKLKEAMQIVEAEKRERLLAQARENRELVAAQMDEDWLGLKLLAYLRKSPQSRATELAGMVGAPIDAVAPVLARLVRFGAVGVERQLFACTERGSELLHRLEASSGISLTP